MKIITNILLFLIILSRREYKSHYLPFCNCNQSADLWLVDHAAIHFYIQSNKCQQQEYSVGKVWTWFAASCTSYSSVPLNLINYGLLFTHSRRCWVTQTVWRVWLRRRRTASWSAARAIEPASSGTLTSCPSSRSCGATGLPSRPCASTSWRWVVKGDVAQNSLFVSRRWLSLVFVSGVTGGHRVVRRHLHPHVEHQRQPHRQRQHLHGPQPADPVLLCVGDERMGHAERDSHRTLGRRRQGNWACFHLINLIYCWFLKGFEWMFCFLSESTVELLCNKLHYGRKGLSAEIKVAIMVESWPSNHSDISLWGPVNIVKFKGFSWSDHLKRLASDCMWMGSKGWFILLRRGDSVATVQSLCCHWEFIVLHRWNCSALQFTAQPLKG